MSHSFFPVCLICVWRLHKDDGNTCLHGKQSTIVPFIMTSLQKMWVKWVGNFCILHHVTANAIRLTKDINSISLNQDVQKTVFHLKCAYTLFRLFLGGSSFSCLLQFLYDFPQCSINITWWRCIISKYSETSTSMCVEHLQRVNCLMTSYMDNIALL